MSDPPAALYDAGLAEAARGNLIAARVLLSQAHALAPHNIPLLVSLGNVLRRLGETDEARAALEEGKLRAPEDAALAFELGQVHRILKNTSGARREFELALRRHPDHHVCRETLIFIELSERNYEAAATLAEAAPGGLAAQSDLLELICIEAAARGDDDASLAYGALAFERLPCARTAMTLARAEFDSGRYDDAEKRLGWIQMQPEVAPEIRARAIGTFADIADKRGDFERAYRNYAASKQLLRDVYAHTRSGRPGSYLNLVIRLAEAAARLDLLKSHPVSDQTAPEIDQACARHVFILGFPRTGSTLLEQCLSGHPDVLTSDESNALGIATASLLAERDPFAALRDTDDAVLNEMRGRYWRHMKQRAPVTARKYFIDKMPFNSVLMGFIPSLFPTAKIVFAVRDPRDIVLSCFRQRFSMNAATAELCTLADSVRLFCAVMRLSEMCRAKLPAPILDCRYEDLVADLPGALSRISDFTGIPWHDDMVHFSQRAKRQPLTTVSAPQLTKGLYDGSGGWLRYEKFLTPHLPALAPWISRFGYQPC
ncbi:MAG: sulfotransferase [Alphaproteobacteria bacterium]|nr:MAG: sulfotransferase [Caulobacteraceae bacterium]TPW08032.1 MAG: sulfotransferase [Alphaproteobacteria bacterium]